MTDRFTGEPAHIPIISHCARCNKPIHEGDDYTDIGEPICQNCADDEDRRLGVKCVAWMVNGWGYDRIAHFK